MVANLTTIQCHSAPILKDEHRPLLHCTDRKCRAQRQPDGTVITGTGRAGTSFLMAVLTTLGLPTGFSKGAVKELQSAWHAGFERKNLPACLCKGGPNLCLHFNQDKQIIKSPQLAQQNQFPIWLAPPVRGLSNVIVPMRSSNETALSRAANAVGPGGFSLGATDHKSQQYADEHLLSTLLVELSKWDIPVTLLNYPRHVQDAHYSAQKLAWLLLRHNISEQAFVSVHSSLQHLSWVHSDSLRRAR